MVPQHTGKPYMNWTQDPRNPRAENVKVAETV
jgi:dihydropyrimidine dehydrogenase (NAD+) subunit PreA